MNGGVKCWGSNSNGQLGNNDTNSSILPVDLKWEADPTDSSLNTGVTAIAVGAFHACALKQGNVYCWGDNTYGQVGISTASPNAIYARKVSGISNATALVAGNNHNCAIVRDAIKCWGNNANGQLGNNTTNAISFSPGNVIDVSTASPLTNVLKITAGANHNCSKATNGNILCWGDNTKGQVGIDPNSTTLQKAPDSSYPVKKTGAVTIPAQEIAAGSNHSCAISNSIAYCWGDNSQNQFGNASSTPASSFIALDLDGI
jgi:alpha-tubulin suppressor-like RCC1 family protein